MSEMKGCQGESQSMPMGPGMMKQCMEMMGKMGMSPEMMQHCQAMMGTATQDSPSTISGRAEELGLSEEQKKKLAAIESEAWKSALEVLTTEQRKKLDDFPQTCMSMMQMCQQMMKEMQEKGCQC